MTEDDYLLALQAVLHGGRGDAETWHIEADELVVKALRQLGWERLATAYAEACEKEFWYA